MAYIERAATIGCIFCEKQREPDGENNLVLARGAAAFVILNAFPYNPGHLMVSPYRHVGEFHDLITLACQPWIDLFGVGRA